MRKNIDCFVSITIYNTVKFMFLKTDHFEYLHFKVI